MQILCAVFPISIHNIAVIGSGDGKDDPFLYSLFHLLVISKGKLTGIYKYAEKQAIVVAIITKTEQLRQKLIEKKFRSAL